MFLELMALIATLQIDSNSSGHDNKGTSESARSIQKIKKCKAQTLGDANTVKLL